MKMNLNYTSSDLDYRISILKRTVTKDDKSNIVETFREYKKVWAYVEVRSAANVNVEELQHGVVRYFIVIRWDKELFSNIDALAMDGRFLRLISPPYKGGLNKFIVLNARELDLDEPIPNMEFALLP